MYDRSQQWINRIRFYLKQIIILHKCKYKHCVTIRYTWCINWIHLLIYLMFRNVTTPTRLRLFNIMSYPSYGLLQVRVAEIGSQVLNYPTLFTNSEQRVLSCWTQRYTLLYNSEEVILGFEDQIHKLIYSKTLSHYASILNPLNIRATLSAYLGAAIMSKL